MESELLIILCTFPDVEKARQIGTALVERQLAACVNVLPGIESIYRWQGKLESGQEVLAIFKTTSERWPALEAALRELHPYDVPEIVALPAAKVSAAYWQWVAAETGSGT